MSSNCENTFLPTERWKKRIVISHIVLIVLLVIIISLNQDNINNTGNSFAGTLVGVLIWGIVAYYYISALLCCGGTGGKIILIPTILFEVLLLIGAIMYLSTSFNETR